MKAVEEGNLSVANVNIGIGTSESETVIESSTVTAHESTVAAEKDVNIKATGKDINIQGSEVKGENVTLNAKENINITAAEQGNVTNTENNTSSGFAGMSIGLGTGTISFSDIKNEAEYYTKGIGMTLDANKTSGNQPSTVGQKGLIPTVPASVGDSEEGTTKSGVSEGKINVTKPEKQKQYVNTLNRDTKNTLNKLDQIFDLEKIREDQETAALFGELAGGATEYLANEILKACKGNKAQAQWVAMIVGAALSKATGGDAQQGAFVAVNAIRNNALEYIISVDDFILGKVLELPEGDCLYFTLGAWPVSEKMMIFHIGDDPSEFPVFITNNVGYEKNITGLPPVGKGYVVNYEKETVTDRKELIDGFRGKAYNIEVEALMGGGFSVSKSIVADAESEENDKAGTYTFVSESVGADVSISFNRSNTYYAGTVSDINEMVNKPIAQWVRESIPDGIVEKIKEKLESIKIMIKEKFS